MKRFILFLLVGALLLLPLSGCLADKQNEETTPANTTENTTPESTTPEVTTPEATTPEATTPPDNNPPLLDGELDKNSELITTLEAYLEQYGAQYYMPGVSLPAKIDGIKNGAQPLHVAFDPNDYYFVCGYYNVTHEYDEKTFLYCCYLEYTWVEYEHESEIQEYWNGMKWAVAFQINRALMVTNILSGESANDMEHFQMYQPVFENERNIEPPIICDKTFIYLNNFYRRYDEDVIYHSTSWYYHSNITIYCIYLDDEYYISLFLTTLKADTPFDLEAVLSQKAVVSRFGDYYDAIIDVMNVGKYNITREAGQTDYYGLVSLDDFANKVIK